MNYEEKLEACRYLLDKEEGSFSVAWYVHMMGVHDLFDYLANKEYLKKKAEFLLPLRDSRGRFKSNNNGKCKL